MATPLLKLRRVVGADGSTSLDPEDYEVVDERGEGIGRMYRTIAVGGGEAWRWTVYCIMVGDHPPTRTGADKGSRAGRVQGAWASCQPRERGA